MSKLNLAASGSLPSPGSMSPSMPGTASIALRLHGLAVALALAAGLGEAVVVHAGWAGLLRAELAIDALRVHGLVLVHFALLPLVPSVVTHALLHRLTGQATTALPRLSAVAGALHLVAVLFSVGAVLTRASRVGYLLLGVTADQPQFWLLALALSILAAANALSAIGVLSTLRASTSPLAGVLSIPTIAQLLGAPLLLASLGWMVAELSGGLGVSPIDPLLAPRLVQLATLPAMAGAVAGGLGLLVAQVGSVERRDVRALGFWVVCTTLAAMSRGAAPESERGALIGAALGLLAFAFLPGLCVRWAARLGGMRARPSLAVIAGLVLAAVWLPLALALEIPGLGDYLRATSMQGAALHLAALGLVVLPALATLGEARSSARPIALLGPVLLFVGTLVLGVAWAVLGARGMPRPFDPLLASPFWLALLTVGGLTTVLGVAAGIVSLLREPGSTEGHADL